MNILVIGSKGFIGTNVYHYFQSKGHIVWGCDVIIDYTATNYFLIDSTNSNFQWIFKQQAFNVCINCSGAANVQESIVNPARDFYLNTVNVSNLLDAIRLYNKDCKFINLSSAAVYGDPPHLPVHESDPLQPKSPYGYNKMMAENLCREYYMLFSIPTCSVRIFSAYGEGLRKQLFWDLFQKSKTQSKVVLNGTGRETRDFIHISDLVCALAKIIENADFKSTVVNVANGYEVSISDAVKMFYALFDKKIEYEFSQLLREGDPLNWKADIEKLRGYGYEQKITMETGLTRFYSWIREKGF